MNAHLGTGAAPFVASWIGVALAPMSSGINLVSETSRTGNQAKVLRAMRNGLLIAAVLSALVPTTAAIASAASYVGNWPVTITDSQKDNGTYCLTLTNYGGASVSGGWENPTNGVFQIVGHDLVATIAVPAGDGDGFVYLVFDAAARKDSLGNGIFDYAGFYDAGKITFGAKGGC